MTITVQKDTDTSPSQKNNQIQNVPASLSGHDSKLKAKLPRKGDYVEDILSDIILNNRGKPDRLAIAIYSHLKSWFQPNKNNSFKKSGKFDVRKHGFRTSYEELAKKHRCSKEAVRQKIVLLEELRLLARNFRIEYEGGVRKNNVLYLLLWKDTPHFYFEHGLEKRQLFKSSINKEKWRDIAKNETGGSPKILGEGVQENLDRSPTNKGGGLQADLDIIISNTTPLLHSNTTPEELKLSTRVLCSSNKDSTINKSSNTRACDPIQQKHATFAPCSLTELEQVALPNQKEKVIELKKLIQQKAIPEMKQEELPKLTDKQTRRMLLSKALYGAFGEQRLKEILFECKFVETHEKKVCIEIYTRLLNDLDKAKIRKCIQRVYDEDVKLVIMELEETEELEIWA
jgi:hypothetical protein